MTFSSATLFYLGFFLAFLNLWRISYWDTAIVTAIATVAIAGVKSSLCVRSEQNPSSPEFPPQKKA
ncbi:hypothetical protein [Oscillatoria sp. FACHB-1406]|uniref:hypothetical protein n=1 Tax=Oscillatoria sp. FACHB-1406 TaxID=2692846 RepID=UPI001688FE72|nr:hypothetical protein [Oscillatoria sp. FACHB-1406]MBD2580658.1 hypothetical protein [Oscillatoria sp. FACHB-1406]